VKVEEYGNSNDKIIVMLHGAHLVHMFRKQYVLKEKYHIIIPHIMGFGDNTEKVFQTEECVCELAKYIKSLHKKVILVGFSLGAQLALKLVTEYEELFESVIVISPWLIKEEPLFSKIMELNRKQLHSLQNRFLCSITGMMNGLTLVQCKEFVSQMQNVKEETIHNMVDNGITLESLSEFAKVSIPVIALAGEKEQSEVKDSVKHLSDINENCTYEIWKKAGHNIPFVFSKRLNELICSMPGSL